MALTTAQMREIERKAAANIPLAGNGAGYVSAESLAYYQQLQTAAAASYQTDVSNQSTGGGVGSSSGTSGGTYPGNDIVPSVTKDAITGYGFTAIVGIGAALIVVSLLSSFRRVRGR